MGKLVHPLRASNYTDMCNRYIDIKVVGSTFK